MVPTMKCFSFMLSLSGEEGDGNVPQMGETG
jgi:hypothetical protein